MVKLLVMCNTCGWDWLAWTCRNCGGVTSRKASQAVMVRLREQYAWTQLEAKYPIPESEEEERHDRR